MNRRAVLLAAVCVILMILRSTVAQESKTGVAGESAKIHREGMRLDQEAVSFRTQNDRLLVIMPNENKQVVVLENLASQRIYRATREDPEDCRWTISGSFTEFEGKNYCLIERAVRLYHKDR